MSMVLTNTTVGRGDRLKLKGKIPNDADSFWIGLGTDERNQALNISSKFSDRNVIVLNSRTGGCWGPEQRVSNTLARGTEVEIVVKVEDASFDIVLPGGQVAYFKMREKMNIITWIQVAEDFKLSCFEIC